MKSRAGLIAICLLLNSAQSVTMHQRGTLSVNDNDNTDPDEGYIRVSNSLVDQAIN